MKTEPLPAATLSNLHQPSELEDPGRAGIGRANAAGAQLAQKIEGRLANSVVFYGELAQAAGPAPPQNTLRAKPADEVPMSAAQQGVQLRETMPPTPEHGADGRPGRLREAMHWARTLFRLIAANAHGWAEVDVDEGTRFGQLFLVPVGKFRREIALGGFQIIQHGRKILHHYPQLPQHLFQMFLQMLTIP